MELTDINLNSLKGNLDVTIEFEEKIHTITTDDALKKMAEDVLDGKYGNGDTRKNNIYLAVQNKVNELSKG